MGLILTGRHTALALSVSMLLLATAPVHAQSSQSTQPGDGTQSTPVAPSLPATTLVAPISPLAIGGAAVVRPMWTFNPRISVDTAFTDNARGAPPGQRESDLYTSISPGFVGDLYLQHHRATIDYGFTRRMYAFDQDLNNNQHSLSASTQSEVVNEIFFIDTQMSLSDTTLNSQGRVSADPTVQFDENSALIATFSASPFLRYQLDHYVNFETRYRYGRTLSLTEGAQDQQSHHFTQTAASGSDFDRFSWGALLDGGWEDFSGQATFGPSGDRRNENYRGVGSIDLPISRAFSLVLGGGYETIKDDTLTDQPDGFIWNVGFRYKPGPRTTLQLGFGDRYDRKRFSGGLSYLISQRSSLTVSYGQSIRSTSPTANNSVAFLAPDGFGNLVDVRTGQALSFTDSLFGVTSATFFSDRIDATLSLGHGLGTSTFTFFYEKRSGSNVQSDEDGMGFSYGYGRPLNSVLSMGFNASVTKTETVGSTPATTQATAINVNNFTNSPEGTEVVTLSAGGSLNYTISDTMSGTLSYRFLNRDSTESGGNSIENVVTAGIRKSF